MAAKKKVTVLIADDQTLFREGIKDLLDGEKSIEVIGEASDGHEAVK
ncbi:MAG: DNA-binding response regulator, partial [Elusimicrobia bacterium]|nr:DNA-binding response regulator [Elusimicrobiota bacterium]